MQKGSLFFFIAIFWGGSAYAWPYQPLENRWSIKLKRASESAELPGLRVIARVAPSDAVGDRERVWIEVVGRYPSTQKDLS